ncbi:MAG: response regulator [Proteobacteria bacterium]|nr:response regulator [Pseudomonadota bacterium]
MQPNLKVISNKSLGTVLIVDDDEDVLELLSDIVKKQGYKVITAVDGKAAMEQFLTQSPILVIADIVMPGMDGIALAQAMKESQKEVPIILISGKYFDLIEHQITKKILADHVLYKPIAPADIVESIGLLLES